MNRPRIMRENKYIGFRIIYKLYIHVHQIMNHVDWVWFSTDQFRTSLVHRLIPANLKRRG